MEETSVDRMLLKSAPARVVQLDGRYQIEGATWGPTPIAAVEAKIDNGPWLKAKLAESKSPYSWRFWSLDWHPTPGDHAITSCAIDTASNLSNRRWTIRSSPTRRCIEQRGDHATDPYRLKHRPRGYETAAAVASRHLSHREREVPRANSVDGMHHDRSHPHSCNLGDISGRDDASLFRSQQSELPRISFRRIAVAADAKLNWSKSFRMFGCSTSSIWKGKISR